MALASSFFLLTSLALAGGLRHGLALRGAATGGAAWPSKSAYIISRDGVSATLGTLDDPDALVEMRLCMTATANNWSNFIVHDSGQRYVRGQPNAENLNINISDGSATTSVYVPMPLGEWHVLKFGARNVYLDGVRKGGTADVTPDGIMIRIYPSSHTGLTMRFKVGRVRFFNAQGEVTADWWPKEENDMAGFCNRMNGEFVGHKYFTYVE